MDTFSVRKILGWLVALLLSKMVHGDLEGVLESCCQTGDAWARNGTTCTGLVQDGLTCLTSAYACCARARRRADCQRGKEAAKAGAPCGTEDSPFRDCCDGCKLGVQAKSQGLPCTFTRFSFGAPWDETYRDCCERASSEQAVVTQQSGPRPILQLGSYLDGSRIEEGDDVYFDCDIREFKTNPRINILTEMGWRFEGQQLVINPSAGVVASRMTPRTQSQSLVIQKVQRENRGRYSCTADGAESNQVYLRVQFRPVCKSGQQTTYGTKLHHPVEIKCEVEADPEDGVHFRWEFNSSSGSAEPTYELDPVWSRGRTSVVHYTPRSEHDYGTLSCWTSNSLGTQREPCLFVVKPIGDVRPNLQLSSLHDSSSILEGSDVTFNCDLRALENEHLDDYGRLSGYFSLRETSWWFEGQQLASNASAGVIVSGLTETTQSLILQKLQRGQRGRYSCVADGKESNQVYLRVQFRPVCKCGQQTMYAAKMHQIVVVSCEVETDPEDRVDFRWEFNTSSGSDPPAQPTYQLVPVPRSGGKGIVHFTPRSEQDYGTLSCWANNSLGSQREPCLFLVKPDDPDWDRPHFVNDPLPMQAVVPVNATPGTSVFKLRAIAHLRTDDVRYFLARGHSRFEVDELSGDVLTVGSEPFELEKEYVVWVVAGGHDMLMTEEERLSIMGGRRPPQFYRTEYEATIPANQKKDADIIEVKAQSFSDKKIRYTLRAQGRGAGIFKIQNTTGIVRLAKDLDSKFTRYWLIVSAYEEISGLSSHVQLIINVTDAPNSEPADPQAHDVDAEVALEASTVRAPPQMNYIRPDELQIKLTHLPEVEGKTGVRVRLVPKLEGHPGYSFYVQYRKKGESVWKRSHPEEYEDFILVHLLDYGSLYEFRVIAVDGPTQTSSKVEEFQTRMDPRVEEELNTLFKNTMKMLDKTGDS